LSALLCVCSDTTWFIRPSADACPNRHMGTASFIPIDSTGSGVDIDYDDDDLAFTALEIILSIAVGVFLVSTVVLSVLFYRLSEKSGARESLIQATGSSDA
jgi:hypothetical protein